MTLLIALCLTVISGKLKSKRAKNKHSSVEAVTTAVETIPTPIVSTLTTTTKTSVSKLKTKPSNKREKKGDKAQIKNGGENRVVSFVESSESSQKVSGKKRKKRN